MYRRGGDMRNILLRLMGAAAVIAVAMPANADHGEAPIEGIVQNFFELDKPVAAPPTPVVSKDEGPITLDRFQGKFVVLNFWATWCGPCIRELPSLNRLNAQFAGDDFAVVLISQDRNGFKQTDRFLKKLKIDIPDAFIDEKLKFSRAIGVRSLPTTILIGPDGNEVGRLTGSAEWDEPEAIALIDFYRAHFKKPAETGASG
ncbi:MAG: thiol-disulfide isomerase/thioredoxin [Alphaproteobacteria bacterium]